MSRVDGEPNEKQRADKGIDGVVRVVGETEKKVNKVLVSVKGGKHLAPTMVRDLIGTVAAQKGAVMGILVTLEEPTRGMLSAAVAAGTYEWELTGQAFPKIQTCTVASLLAGDGPKLPPVFRPIPVPRESLPDDSGQ